MFPDKNELEKARTVIKSQYDASVECMNFAVKYDMLGLFDMWKEKVNAYHVALHIINEKLDSLKPLKAG